MSELIAIDVTVKVIFALVMFMYAGQFTQLVFGKLFGSPLFYALYLIQLNVDVDAADYVVKAFFMPDPYTQSDIASVMFILGSVMSVVGSYVSSRQEIKP